MKIDEELAQSSLDRDSVLTIGVFDGVHRGHAHLIGQLIREAAATERAAGVVTFRAHPAELLRPDFHPQYLAGLDDRIRLIEGLGVDFVVPVTFDLELAKLSSTEFVARLQDHLRMRGLVVGPDFAMGRRREGNVTTLAEMGKQMGFTLTVVDLLEEGSEAVRSTSIRQALAQGDVAHVSGLLGRHFAVAGVVVKGAGRGITLGFPTANLQVPPGMAVPGDGIYATWARVGELSYMAATSIGTRPTFDETERTMEAFILDFDSDLYRKDIRLEFVERLRDEERYDSVEALREQIGRDVDQTRAALTAAQPATD